MRTKVKQLYRSVKDYDSKQVNVMGWVRSNRSQSQFGFLSINDGSFFDTVQVVYDNKLVNFEEISKFRVGVSVNIIGKVVLTPENETTF